MIAVDTNVVLRLLLGDDAGQLATVRALMERETLFVPLTVLLEAGWVMQSRYDLPRAAVADALQALSVLEGVVVARLVMVDWAIARYRSGADLADVIHLAAAGKHDGFATFDRRLARDVGVQAPVTIETLA